MGRERMPGRSRGRKVVSRLWLGSNARVGGGVTRQARSSRTVDRWVCFVLLLQGVGVSCCSNKKVQVLATVPIARAAVSCEKWREALGIGLMQAERGPPA